MSPVRPDARLVSHVLFFLDLEQLPVGAIHETGPALREAVRRMPAPARLSLVSHMLAPSTLVWEEDLIDRVTDAVDGMTAAAEQLAQDSVATAGRYFENPHVYEQRQSYERILINSLLHAIDLGSADSITLAWGDIGRYVAGERTRVQEMLRGLRSVCGELARLDGRKTVVFVSRGFERAPGFNFLNAVDVSVRARANPRAGEVSPRAPFPGAPGAGAGGLTAMPVPEYDDFVRWIAASGITLHFLDPSRGTDFVSAEMPTGQRFRPLSTDRRNLQDSGANLADVTGGLSAFQPGALDTAFASLLDASSGSYRLGIRMTEVDPRRSYKVSVSVKRKGVRVLSRSAYQPKAPATAAPADVAQADRQRLRAGVDDRKPGAGRQVLKPIALSLEFRGKSSAPPVEGKGLYKLDVLVPVDDLKFVLEEETMVASTRLSVIAESTEGKGKESFSEDLFLSMTAKEYAAAAGTNAAKTLTLTLVPGNWTVTVSITDLLETRTGIARTTVVAEP